MSAEKQIQALVDDFVRELTLLVQQSALEQVHETLSQALGTPSAPAARQGRTTRKKAGKKKARKAAARRSKGGRRSSADVDGTAEAALAFIRGNPGCAIGEVGTALGLSTKDLRLPMQKLLAEGKVRTTGQKRGTRYHAGGGKATKAPARKKTAKKKATRKKASKKKTTRKKS